MPTNTGTRKGSRWRHQDRMQAQPQIDMGRRLQLLQARLAHPDPDSSRHSGLQRSKKERLVLI